MAEDGDWVAAVYGGTLGLDEGFDGNPAHRIVYVPMPFTPFEKVVLSAMAILAMSMIGCVVGVSCRSCMRAYRRHQRWSRYGWVLPVLPVLPALPALDGSTDIEAAGNGAVLSRPESKGVTHTQATHTQAVVLVAHPDDHLSLGT